MQPTDDEIQREMDSIRSMRRISSQSGPGSLTLDPDLPLQPSSGSSTSPSSATRHSPTNPYATLPSIAALGLPGTTANGELIPPAIGEDETVVPGNGEFFWVPASLHPELAPSEFKAFLRDHRRDVEETDDNPAALGRVGSIGLQRSSSGLSRSGSGLGRKKSMLSRQYHPGRDTDDMESIGEESVKPMRNRSVYRNAAPQLTIKDLQKLDDLADAAAAGDGASASLIKSQLRRSISLGFSGSIADHIDGMKEPETEEDSPVIVPAKALQRTARTRIRKPGLEGDGGGHRFANTRRGGKRTKTMDSSAPMPGSSFEDLSGRPSSAASDHASLSDQESEPYARPRAPSPDQYTEGDRTRPRFAGTTEEEERPISMGESIYDAYGGGDQDGDRDSMYYDARESGSFDKTERVTSGGSIPGTRSGGVFESAEEDEPFLAGSKTKTAAGTGPGYSTPTVILRQQSPEHQAPEQLPFTQQSPKRTGAPTSIELPPSPYSPPAQQQQQQPYPNPVSTPSTTPSFVKEYGYQQQYGQPLPPSQMYQQPAGIHHPTPKRHLDVPLNGQPGASPPVSPELIRSPSISPSAEAPFGRPFSAPPGSSGRPSSAEKKAEKEKEKSGKGWGLFGRGGKDKEKEKEKEKREKETTKKTKKEKEKPEAKATPKEEKEKEGGGGLFSLFGSGKRKHDGDSSSSQGHASSNQNHATGAKAAAKNALLPFATASPALAGQYARYPLHVERAVYRLSHIKLANPRRPLYEQVLISNLMFWYLGIINKPATPTTPPAEQNKLPANGEGAPAQPATNGAGQPIMSTAMSPAQQAAVAQQAAAAASAEKARLEQERLEQEEREKEERERELLESQERERREREAREKERLEKERAEREQPKNKKAGLTKAERDGRTRKAEMPVKGPNYDVQSRAMEQEYAWEQQERSGSRPSTSPTSARAGPQHTAYHLPVRAQGQRPGGGSGPQQPYFHQQDMSQVVYQPINPYALPPGAKPPATVENSWAVSSNAAATANEAGNRRSPPPNQPYYDYTNGPSNGSSNDRPRPTRSPPPHDYLNSGIPNGARPARSLSASAQNRPSGPTASGSFPGPANSTPRQAEHERPAHTYSQSTSAVVGQANGVPPQQPPAPSSGRLQKKKSTGNTNVAGDGTKPTARRRKSVEAGAGDRRGIVEPDVSFENMWQQQFPAGGYSQYQAQQPAQMQGQQGWYR